MKYSNIFPIKFIFFIFSSVFFILIILSAFSQPASTITNLTGRVGIVDNQQLIDSLPIPWNFIYEFGDRWCHQISDRSFSLNGNQLPVCMRCVGIFAGIPLGILLSLITKMKTGPALVKQVLTVVGIGVLPIVIDGGGQLVGFWVSSSLSRIVTGFMGGIAIAYLLMICLGIISYEIERRRNISSSR